MKLSIKHLRKIIQEVYKMTPEDVKGLKINQLEKGGLWDMMTRDKPEARQKLYTNLRRAKGRQSQEEIYSDRQELQMLQAEDDYYTLVDAFNKDDGVATAIYSLTYQGTYTASGKDIIINVPEWIERFGTYPQTKNSISTKAFVGPINEIPPSIGEFVGIGVILKGYPVLVSATDAYSQTMSISPQGLIDHQASSGFAKRGDVENAHVSLEDWLADYNKEPGISHETILDNWRVVGVVVNEKVFNQVNREDIGIDELGMPVHIINASGTYKGLA
tara:strand:- start:2847 stop:3668 length:822 start_codon:yes stop_codon:yes gene_type:complete